MKIIILILTFVISAFSESAFKLDSAIISGAVSVLNPVELWPLPSGMDADSIAIGSAFEKFCSDYEKSAVRTCGFILRKTYNTKNKTVRVFIDICESDFVSAVSCSGNNLINFKEISQRLYHKPGRCFSAESLNADRAAIITLYSGRKTGAKVDIDVTGGHEKRLLFIIKEVSPQSSIVFEGNTVVKVSELESIYKKGVNYAISKYHSLGYVDVLFKEKSVINGVVTVEVTEGRQKVCGPLRIADSGKFPADSLLFFAAWQSGRPFTSSRLDECIESIINFHGERAYPFAEVHVDDLIDSAGILMPVLSINSGDRFYFGAITIPGSEKIKPSLIKKLLKIEAGSPWSENQLLSARSSLQKSQLFEYVDSAKLSIKTGYRIIDASIEVREGARNQAEGIIGYVPDENSENRITGLLKLNLKNLLGTGRAVNVFYQSEGNYSSASVRYREPWLLGTLFDAEGMVDFKSDRELYSRLETKLTLFYPLSDNMKVRTGLINSSETRFAAVSDSLPSTLNSFQTLFGLRFDNRDSERNPKKGLVLDLSGETGKISSEDKSQPVFRPIVYGEAVFNVRAMQVAAVQAAFDGVAGSSELFGDGNRPFVGGTESVRGYRERQFSGLSKLYVRTEYRFITGSLSRFALFTDLGLCDPESPWLGSINLYKDLLVGSGFAILLGTRAGQLGLSYGVAVRESIKMGKIHISLKNEF
ncbi:MAG: BamA/TamA family outer membrane protein [Fibrobacteres bacterium]|nr:BamA/TamA family outer membrane protein [Fibrobacterota bacterium]